MDIGDCHNVCFGKEYEYLRVSSDAKLIQPVIGPKLKDYRIPIEEWILSAKIRVEAA